MSLPSRKTCNKKNSLRILVNLFIATNPQRKFPPNGGDKMRESCQKCPKHSVFGTIGLFAPFQDTYTTHPWSRPQAIPLFANYERIPKKVTSWSRVSSKGAFKPPYKFMALWDWYIYLCQEKYPGWLGYIRDDTTQLYGDFIKPLLSNQDSMERIRPAFFSWLTYTRRWFQILFMFIPTWGRLTQFDDIIFFKWVGSTTNQLYMYPQFLGCPWKLVTS